jgi:hypothetical protein
VEEEPENDQEDTRTNALAVFFSNRALYMMQSATELFIEGTFSTVPPQFKQIVFVSAKEGDKRSVPVVFADLCRKVCAFLNYTNIFWQFTDGTPHTNLFIILTLTRQWDTSLVIYVSRMPQHTTSSSESSMPTTPTHMASLHMS